MSVESAAVNVVNAAAVEVLVTCVNICCICCCGVCIWVWDRGYWCEVEAWLYVTVWAILVPITCRYLCCCLSLCLSLITKLNVSCWNSSYKSLVSCTTSTFRKSQKPSLGSSGLSSLSFLTTLSFNSVIPLWDSARADWRSESAKLEVTLTPRDLGVGVCVSRLDRSAGSSVESGREVSWKGSMCLSFGCWARYCTGLGSRPLENPEFTFRCKMVHDVVSEEVKLSQVHFCFSVSCGSPWPDFMWVTFLKSVRGLENHLWQASLSM